MGEYREDDSVPSDCGRKSTGRVNEVFVMAQPDDVPERVPRPICYVLLCPEGMEAAPQPWISNLAESVIRTETKDLLF